MHFNPGTRSPGGINLVGIRYFVISTPYKNPKPTKMTIEGLHPNEKDISLVPVFEVDGVVSAMRILAGKTLKKHITKLPAFLICVTGSVVFKNEHGMEQILEPGDYIEIEPMVEHWVDGGDTDSNLLLIK